MTGASSAAVIGSSSSSLAQNEGAAKLRALEATTGGRLGVFALDTTNERRFAHRADERFPMCSTFKFLAVAAVLARVDAGEDQLGRHIALGQGDLLEYAPIAREHVAGGFMTLSALCEAAIVYSDNTAANFLLRTLSGPSGVTRFARRLGDSLTNLTRSEPELNSALPGDARDTTTPAAMANDMRALLFGDALSPQARTKLEAWLVACRTGLNCIRAGVPPSWRVGDKTGSGSNGTRNDIAVAISPNRAPPDNHSVFDRFEVIVKRARCRTRRSWTTRECRSLIKHGVVR